MHISDGIISGEICAASAAAAAVVTAISLKFLKKEEVPKTAVLTAAFFVASLVHIRIGPTSGHLVLNGLLGTILGLSAFPAIIIALMFQAVMFQHGGLTSLGVNSIILGIPAIVSAVIFRFRISNSPTAMAIRAFISGTSGVLLSTIIVALYLVYTGEEFLASAKVVIIANIVIAMIEGYATSLIVLFLSKIKPEIIFNK